MIGPAGGTRLVSRKVLLKDPWESVVYLLAKSLPAVRECKHKEKEKKGNMGVDLFSFNTPLTNLPSATSPRNPLTWSWFSFFPHIRSVKSGITVPPILSRRLEHFQTCTTLSSSVEATNHLNLSSIFRENALTGLLCPA